MSEKNFSSDTHFRTQSDTLRLNPACLLESRLAPTDMHVQMADTNRDHASAPP